MLVYLWFILSLIMQNLAYELHTISNGDTVLGEALHWDIKLQSMWYTDVMTNRLLRYSYKNKKVYQCYLVGGKMPSFILPIENRVEHFAVGCGRQVCIVKWNGISNICIVKKIQFKIQQGNEYNGIRFNDGKCDKNGRLFSGTMLHHEAGNPLENRNGVLIKYDHGTISFIKKNIGISNGLGFNENNTLFYYIDTLDFNVKEYDYNLKKGIISNVRIAYDFSNENSVLYPDGMTIDKNGLLYITMANENKVRIIDPRTNQLISEIEFPCDQISAAAFGGPRMDELWITTTSINNRSSPCGKTFKIIGLNTIGYAMNTIRL